MFAQHFERFVQVYDERFAPTRGPLTPGAQEAVYRYLDCGIFANGFARVRCGECGHDFFVPTAPSIGFRLSMSASSSDRRSSTRGQRIM